MVILSFVCALILSVMASSLRQPQEEARELDRSKEMLKSAQILSYEGYFQVQDKSGNFVPAKIESSGLLSPIEGVVYPSKNQILDLYTKRIVPMVVNDKGDLSTFEKEKINYGSYLNNFRKIGYFTQPWKLIYKILPNEEKDKEKADGWIIPINGFGLWDAMYGYLAIKPDGNTVIGISWYDQKETPGLGANVTEWSWQKQFPGKVIFQPSPDGKTDFKTAPLGIDVVRGKVNEVFGNQPRSKSAVDGMAGATLTGNGVTDAYHDVLAGYRPFLIKLHEGAKEEAKNGAK
jgi:Na+-transporting NADH:ubiquinone oxidoreductase subunit C